MTTWAEQNADPRMEHLTHRRCLCRTCGEFFNSTHWFDAHRYGPGADRKCRNKAWMAEENWYLTDLGFWLGPNRPFGGRKRGVEATISKNTKDCPSEG